MRKGKRGLLVYFPEAEMHALKRKAADAGLSCSEFVRLAVKNKEIKQAPPVEMLPLMRHIHRVGDNLNQLLKHVNSGDKLDLKQMRKVLDQISQAADTIIKAYTMED